MTPPAPPLSPSSTQRVNASTPPVSTTTLVLVHVLVWAALQALVQSNLDSYHDMLENFAWAQTFEWGTFKHPPVFAWVVGLWFEFMPTTDWAYRLLAYANVGLGLWGVAALAQRLQLAHLAPTAVLLLLWTLPYTTLAAKFNANSQLLSLWPWTAVALLAAMEARGLRAWGWHVALGLLAGASLLSKYYSGVFLLGFLMVALTRAEGRRWLRGPWPWLALGVFVLALWPHLAWLQDREFATLGYAMNQGDGDTEWLPLLKFALTPVGYWGLAWLAAVATHAFGTPSAQDGGAWRRLAQGLVHSWRPQGWDDALFWLAVLPGGITLLFGVAGVAELSTPWAIPIGYAFSLLWLRNLNALWGPATGHVARQRLRRAAWPVLALVVALGALHGWQRASQGHPDHYRPAQQAAQDILALWQHEHPQLKLGWVGGAWADNALLAFYGDHNIRALPGLPDEAPATLAPHPGWAQEGGVLLCPLGPVGQLGPVGAVPAAMAPDAPTPDENVDATRYSQVPQACVSDVTAWLKARGQPVQAHVLRVARQGWRHPREEAFGYAVFFYRPAVTPAAR